MHGDFRSLRELDPKATARLKRNGRSKSAARASAMWKFSWCGRPALIGRSETVSTRPIAVCRALDSGRSPDLAVRAEEDRPRIAPHNSQAITSLIGRVI